MFDVEPTMSSVEHVEMQCSLLCQINMFAAAPLSPPYEMYCNLFGFMSAPHDDRFPFQLSFVDPFQFLNDTRNGHDMITIS